MVSANSRPRHRHETRHTPSEQSDETLAIDLSWRRRLSVWWIATVLHKFIERTLIEVLWRALPALLFEVFGLDVHALRDVGGREEVYKGCHCRRSSVNENKAMQLVYRC